MHEKDPEDSPRVRLASPRSEAEIAAERQRQDAERAAEALSYAVRELAVCCDGAPVTSFRARRASDQLLGVHLILPSKEALRGRLSIFMRPA